MHVEQAAPALMIRVHGLEETQQVGQFLAEMLEPGCVIGLIGPLGAGKTFLSRAIAESLGVPPLEISSPTYILINEYQGRLPVYHFDTYRLDSKEAFDDLGACEYLGGTGVCLVEWADRVRDRLPEDAWMIRLDHEGGDDRLLTLELPETCAAKLVERCASCRSAEARSAENG